MSLAALMLLVGSFWILPAVECQSPYTVLSVMLQPDALCKMFAHSTSGTVVTGVQFVGR